ncbi:MAG: fumarylacetoacetate hydrolase family protein, partial [Chloroflexota bacterium]|nr:fumarylacetoacetate hydrolase family protein [Chloroflexota bacterium]
MEPASPATRHRPSFGLMAWFVWVGLLLGVTGLLLPRIIAFVDFSEKAPFSLLGLFMMAELAVVIGRRASQVAPDRALDHIFGYTILNDVTARDLQREDRQW